MNGRVAIAIGLLASIAPRSGSEHTMERQSPRMKQRAEAFKARIGFDRAGSGEIAGRGVVAPWPSCAVLLGLPDGQGWAGDWDEPSHVQRGVVSRTCAPRRRDEWLSVEIAVSSAGATEARERLVEKVNETSMVEIPFEPSPEGPGTLAVRSVARPADTYLWTYYNACVEIRRFRGGVDVLALARNVQRFLEQHLVEGLAARVPRIDAVTMTPRGVKVGASARIEAVLAAGSDRASLDVDVPWDGLTLEEHGADWWRVAAVAPGRHTVTVSAIDRATLLSSSREATLDVTQ